MNNDSAFFNQLLQTFRVEADEHLKTLSDGLLILEKTPKPELIESIFRAAHSLKGAARAVNQKGIQDVCQEMENVLSAWQKGTLTPTPGMFDTLYKTIDTVKKGLESPIESNVVVTAVEQLHTMLNATPQTNAPQQAIEPKLDKLIQGKKKEVEAVPISASDATRDKTVRISLSKLDRLFQEAEEMLMVKLVAQQDVADLSALYSDFKNREKDLQRIMTECRISGQKLHEAHAIHQEQKIGNEILDFLSQHQSEMKAFGEALNRKLKTAQQNAHFVGSLIDALLEDIKKVLMQPLSTLFDTMPRMVRDIAKELGKEINLESNGGAIEVDRRILEEIKDPLIHMLRNAVDHGIEPPEARVKNNKPRVGTIRLIATETGGGNIELLVTDDGVGFDLEKLKSAAVKQEILSRKDSVSMADEEVIKLAFHSGVSTAPIITDLSGRGLGLGIVSEKTDKLGGHVFVDSKPGQGTTFRLVLPSTLATFRGIHVTVADQDFIIPAHNVKRVVRIRRRDIKTIENLETITVDKQPLAFVHLANLLNLAVKKKEHNDEEYVFALIVKSEEKTLALGADLIHREHEVLVKGLGKQCVRVKNIMAATIMEWGTVIPILNPLDLVRNAIRGDAVKGQLRQKKEGLLAKKTILVAEDSITTRLLLQNILETAGYEVKTAADGLEALEFLQARTVDMLVTDVEMPRMDGFTLVSKVKGTDALKDLPVIICTGKGSAEDRERGIELGANAYIDKSSFTQAGLLSIAQRLL